jgi:SAM-dependent methyltransferase
LFGKPGMRDAYPATDWKGSLHMATTPAIDQAKAEQFMETVLGHYSGTMSTLLSALGDKLGLWKTLDEGGPATGAELAERAGVDERYAREWLRGMAAAGYIEHDRGTDRYSLPPEHALVFSQEGGPMFLCGGYQMIPAIIEPYMALERAFREGGGVAQSEYGPEFWEGMERFSEGWLDASLLGEWLPAMPHLEARLKEGLVAADVGCGAGRAVIRLAQAYPNSRFTGFDIFEAQVERARRNAEQAGVADRVSFEVRDISQGLPEAYDLITTFDVVHDAVDPRGLVAAIRKGLKDDGSYLMLEINCADKHTDNQGPLAAMFYGFSVFYCMTTSLANDGDGLGTCGMPEAKVREVSEAAGFGSVARAGEDPFNVLYEIRP